MKNKRHKSIILIWVLVVLFILLGIYCIALQTKVDKLQEYLNTNFRVYFSELCSDLYNNTDEKKTDDIQEDLAIRAKFMMDVLYPHTSYPDSYKTPSAEKDKPEIYKVVSAVYVMCIQKTTDKYITEEIRDKLVDFAANMDNDLAKEIIVLMRNSGYII